MLRRSLPLLRRGLSTKASTGIVGLRVEPKGREVLMQLSASILKAVAAFPETAHYRRVVERVYTERLEACQAHAEVADIELAVGQGQIEELIEMARDEQKLIPKMAGAWASGGARVACRSSAPRVLPSRRCTAAAGRVVWPWHAPASPQAAPSRAGCAARPAAPPHFLPARSRSRAAPRRVEAVGGAGGTHRHHCGGGREPGASRGEILDAGG